MSHNSLPPQSYYTHDKVSLLFIYLGGFFVANAIIAEFVGVKVFSVERSLGFEPLNFYLLGLYLSLNFTAGALLWPLQFVITDIINEYFGRRGVKILSYITIILICYAFIIVFFTIHLTPADFWITRRGQNGSMVDMDAAFDAVFGQGLWIIIGSLVAFLIAQLVDIAIFHRIKSFTGEKHLWLRTTGSTLVSQLVDSFVVLIISFHVNPATNWDLSLVLAIGFVKYFYKFIMALILTPLVYMLHNMIDYYLGEPLASQLKQRAMQEDMILSIPIPSFNLPNNATPESHPLPEMTVQQELSAKETAVKEQKE